VIVIVQAIRAYGSSDYYGLSPRQVPDENPLIIDRFPKPRHRTLIHFGLLPTDIVRGNKVRLAIGRFMLDGLFGGHDADTLPDERIDRYLQGDDGTQSDTGHNWYVTFVVEKEIDIEDTAIGVGRYVWLDHGTLDTQIEAILDEAPYYIDLLAAHASTVIDPRMFEDVVLSDRVFFSLAGRETFGLPVAKASATLSVGRQTIPFSDLDKCLRKVANASASSHSWLSSIPDVHLAALNERDSWKQFYWSFAVLEMLCRKLAPRIEGPGIDRTDRALRDDFAVLAHHLFPQHADEDVALFAALVKLRNKIHSGGTIPEGSIVPIRDLHLKYFSAATGMMLRKIT